MEGYWAPGCGEQNASTAPAGIGRGVADFTIFRWPPETLVQFWNFSYFLEIKIKIN